MAKKSGREGLVVKACLLLLRRYGAFRRQNTGAVKMGSRWVCFGKKGQADIVGSLKPEVIGQKYGIYLEVECKTDTGRQSDHQKAHQAEIEAAGGVYLLVRSAGELEAKLKAL